MNDPIALTKAQLNIEYAISKIATEDDELNSFLFTLGCYEGERITVISQISNTFVISVKDARYSIDADIANCVLLMAL